MSGRTGPLPADIIEMVRALPANVIAQTPTQFHGGWSSTIDCGPRRYVSDAVPCCGGRTPEAAAEDVKAWLLDDLQCLGRKGKLHYQPHWDSYDLRYRLGKHWQEKLQLLSPETA